MKLDAETLFFMACCDAYRDGTCEFDENKTLNKLWKAIGLKKATAIELAGKARAGGTASVEQAGAFDAVALFTAACQVAWVDAELETDETRILVELAATLGISYEESSKILKETKSPA